MPPIHQLTKLIIDIYLLRINNSFDIDFMFGTCVNVYLDETATFFIKQIPYDVYSRHPGYPGNLADIQIIADMTLIRLPVLLFAGWY